MMTKTKTKKKIKQMKKIKLSLEYAVGRTVTALNHSIEKTTDSKGLKFKDDNLVIKCHSLRTN